MAKKEETKVVKPKTKLRAVDVFEGNKWLRTFSEEVHGKGFLKMAEELTGKNPSRTIRAFKKGEENK